MKAIAAALDRGNVVGTFDVLKKATVEVPSNEVAADAIRFPAAGVSLDRMLERYAQLFLAVERAQENGRALPLSGAHELATASAALDRVRPYATENAGAANRRCWRP